MFIYTAKVSKWKLIGVLCAAAALLLLVIFLAVRPGKGAQVSGQKLGENEDRVEYLSGCGYTVAEKPERVQEVRIPEEFTQVYEQYNAMQKTQGFDLSRYRGKTVTQYVYRVENYPQDNGDPVYATLLVYRKKLVGADLSRGGAESFLRPLLSA